MSGINAPHFPDRRDVISNKKTYFDSLIEQAKSIDVDKTDWSNSDFKPRSEIVEKQKTYFWIRVYTNEESDLTPDQDVTIEYRLSGESLIARFICFAKKGLDKDLNEQVVNYNSEDDKKILCLMIDADRINKESDDIPFIRTLFRIGRYYSPQILRKDDIVVKDSQGNKIEYFDIDF